jgi:hypothetical protein
VVRNSHCGSLRVVASGEPEFVYVCHCRSCQRRTGAVVHSGCAYPKDQVRIEGDNNVYERDTVSPPFLNAPSMGFMTTRVVDAAGVNIAIAAAIDHALAELRSGPLLNGVATGSFGVP